MKYALGNMLNGAGGLNADQLALDLQFASDKTLTARKGPSPILTRGSTGTFVGSNGLIQTAAVNAARFDHDPVTLASRGLLIEEGRTNLFTQSETWQTGANFTGPTAPTVTNDTTTSPDGLLTADTLSGSTGTAIDGSVTSTWRQPNISSATAYTFSIYVRSLGVATKAEIRIRDNSTGASVQTLDTSLTSSWKRLSVTATTGATTTSIRCIIQNTDGPIAIWGAQLEAGAFPTSYIPTTTSALARSADVCSITGANFTGMYNQPEGTYQMNYSFIPGYSVVGSSTTLVQASNNNFNDLTRVGSASGSLNQRLDTVSGGTLTRITSSNSQSLTAQNKISAAYKVGSNAMSLNGGSVATGSPVSITFLATRLDIGSNHDASSKMNGHIAVFRYYKKRLDNAKLVSLTV